MTHYLCLNAVSKIIHRKCILRNITYTFYGGKIYGISGENGAGKTVLLKTIAGLSVPSSGRLLWDDQPIGRNKRPLETGITVDGFSLYPYWSLSENLYALAAVSGNCDKEYINSIVSSVGLDINSPLTLSNYSLGMRQRALIAQALMNKPDLLLLDEPTNGVDKEWAPQILALLHNEAKRGALVIITSHIQKDLTILCDEQLYMKEGMIVDKW